ncbi:DoxX family protein [Saccharopolyspora sp. NPDC002686]|uniref:DoxX family protein n=1 Tax=Saccharopolyspora sp. NPDC002686 TaxID=3154541 RepID=UPI0033195F2C
MTGLPHTWWPTALLALVLFGDAVMSLKPPVFIQRCLEGVNLPRDWWWILIAVKLLATAGLLVGLEYPGIAFATNAAVIAYFLCAVYAHIRAQFLKQEFWLNCLGMLTFSTAVLVFSYAV